jgi:hypothetical protein
LFAPRFAPEPFGLQQSTIYQTTTNAQPEKTGKIRTNAHKRLSSEQMKTSRFVPWTQFKRKAGIRSTRFVPARGRTEKKLYHLAVLVPYGLFRITVERFHYGTPITIPFRAVRTAREWAANG